MNATETQSFALFMVTNSYNARLLQRGLWWQSTPSQIKRRFFQFRRSYVTLDLR